MSQEANSLAQGTGRFTIEEGSKRGSSAQTPFEELLDSLKKLQDNVGQICELASEEKRLVAAFFESFLKLMQPIAGTIPISVKVLPEGMRDAEQAGVDPNGLLVVLHKSGSVELRDLREEKHRDLLITVMKDAMPKLNSLTTAYRRKIEERISFLSALTREFQRIAKAFSASDAK